MDEPRQRLATELVTEAIRVSRGTPTDNPRDRVVNERLEEVAQAVRSFKEEAFAEEEGDRVRTARPEFVEELNAPAGTHFHVLVVTFSKDLPAIEPRWSDDRKVQLILNPSMSGKYTEHSLVGTSIKEIITLARKLGGPFQTEWSIFRVRQVEDGYCARPDLVITPE